MIKGRALYYPLLLMSCWVGGRAYLAPGTAPAQFHPAQVHIADHDPPTAASFAQPTHAADRRTGVRRLGRTGPLLQPRSRHPHRQLMAQANPAAVLLRAPFGDPVSWTGTGPAGRRTAGMAVPEDALAGTANDGEGNSGIALQGRLFAYAYSFWRMSGADQPSLASAAQYGGSQSGIQFGYDLDGQRDSGLAIVASGAATPSAGGEELALGLRWQRPAKLPLALNAERRVILNGRDKWAFYAAGGFDGQPLPARFRLDGYGQLGWASGDAGGAFFDTQLRASRPLARVSAAKIGAGAAIWAGGQEDVHRIDIGPTVTVDYPLGETRIDIRLDWRHRIAGNARPGGGAALTVATAF